MELIQPILVEPSGSHEDIVTAVMLASIGALEEVPSVNWKPWLEGSFTKSVRRSKKESRVIQAMNEIKGFHVARVRKATAVAFAPMDKFPRVISRMRVDKLNAERTGDWFQFSGAPTIAINPTLKMSTGKTAAQVAHGAMVWRLSHNTSGHDLDLRYTITDDPGAFQTLQMREGDGTVEIRDLGLTEVKPNSLTVIVGLR